MTTWQPVSLSGFRRAGFISSAGSKPHASAWAACARPISPPPRHTAALLDMFCDLNGATRTPDRANNRQRPATTTLFADVGGGSHHHQGLGFRNDAHLGCAL